MTSEGQIFSQEEMSVAIKKMKENKAADESGVIAEYLKALEVEKLRGLINGILNGADIPKEWKESRVKLLHKVGRTDELKNYRPIAIINTTCKLCMLMVRERIDNGQKIVECWVKFKAVSEEGGVQKITCLC